MKAKISVDFGLANCNARSDAALMDRAYRSIYGLGQLAFHDAGRVDA